MLDLLRPFFRGDWAQYGESLQLLDGKQRRPSVEQWLANPAHLEHALIHHARTLNDARERKAIVSNWILRYLNALLPPVVALSSLLKYSVPTGWRDMTLTLNEVGSPVAFSIEHIGSSSPRTDAATRYEPLVWLHLEPLFAQVTRLTHVPSKILRGNARRTLLGIFAQALPLVSAVSAMSAALIEDRRQLLESPLWPDGRRNPLFLNHRQVPVSTENGSQLLTLHASCCLAYQLPGTGHCVACPLAPRFRKHGARH